MPSPLGISLIDLPALQDLVSAPSYTDIFNQTMGDAASDADGFDAALADVVARLAAFEAEQSATETAVNVGGLIDRSAAVDPASLDASMAGYTNAMAAGAAHLAAGQALAPPALLELPMSPGFGAQITAPPTQKSMNLGTMHTGKNALVITLGSYRIRDSVQDGFVSAHLADGDTAIFQVVDTLTYSHETYQHDTENHTITLNVTPTKAGHFVAQVNSQAGTADPIVITTYTLDVIDSPVVFGGPKPGTGGV